MRVLQYGVGAMGSLMVQLLSTRRDVSIVGAIDIDPDKIDCDLGDVANVGQRLGINIEEPKALRKVTADVALHATTAYAEEAYPIISSLIDQRLNVITIAQELFFPLGKNLKIAAELDRQAKRAGVRVTSAGINPGFILDVLPIACSMPCWSVEGISGRRVVDFSPYGPDEMRHIGAGLTAQQFLEGAREGKIGHVGLLESAGMIGHSLGLDVDELKQTKSPIISQRTRKTAFASIPAGRVCGFRQSVRGTTSGREKINLEMIGILAPGPDDIELGDHFRIIGTPSVDVFTKEEISQKGGIGTAAIAVNTIPRLLHASVGFHSSNQLLMPSFWHQGTTPADRIGITNVVQNVG
jgi:4-hydroxy-tetrahydrodipicolinate reductase